MPADGAITLNYVLDEQVGYLLRLAGQRHASIFQNCVPEGLTPMQFSALVRLGEHGSVSQNRLGRLAAMDAATIKGVVDRLLDKGLVTRKPSPEDRRRAIVSLSTCGAGLIGGLHRAGARITDETMAPLTTGERDTLVRLLEKIS